MSEPDYSPPMLLVERDPASVPLDRIDVSQWQLWVNDAHWPYFERLRREDPVHWCAESEFGGYWSVTKFDDIVAVEKSPEIFSSEPNITIADRTPESITQNAGFITMDGPRHLAHRKAVQPVSSPRNLKALEPMIREHAVQILDGLPVGETFNWVDRVSIELTTRMLATMFDFPWEERRKLTYWSDVITSAPGWPRRHSPWKTATRRCASASRRSGGSGRSGRGERAEASTSSPRWPTPTPPRTSIRPAIRSPTWARSSC